MIIYYQKSTKKILRVLNDNAKKHLDDIELKKELNNIFPDMEDDVDVSRFKEDVQAKCGGTWDEKKKEMTSPPIEPEMESSPEGKRMVELKEKFETQTATLAEVQEYLFLRDK